MSETEKKLQSINIIIEGCDCTGKSTLAKRFQDLGMKYVKCSAPKSYKEAMQEYNLLVDELNTRRGLVLDRGLLGERVYAPLMRDYYPNYMPSFEQRLADHNYLIVLTADNDVIQKRFDDIFITRDMIPLVNGLFTYYSKHNNWPHTRLFDTTNHNPEQLQQDILQYIGD